MTEPKAKGAALSQGAKTYIQDLAKQHVYGYVSEFSTKEVQKGIIVEQDSIALLNQVLFSALEKNDEHRANDWIQGTCDIRNSKPIHDVKSSWSLDTFPVTAEDAADKGYEWQVRGYMMLWDRDEAEVDHCLVDTPDELIGWDNPAIHKVSHIDPLLRVTRVRHVRDAALEQAIVKKVEAARSYYLQAIEEIYNQHQ